jgi:hypothetical protein
VPRYKENWGNGLFLDPSMAQEKPDQRGKTNDNQQKTRPFPLKNRKENLVYHPSYPGHTPPAPPTKKYQTVGESRYERRPILGSSDLVMLPEYEPKRVRYLTKGAGCSRTINDERHQVLIPLGALLKEGKSLLHARNIARSLKCFQL